MRSVGREKTKPEMLIRRALHAQGYRFRANVRTLPGTPDLAFMSRQKAIFVHGCFWHRHTGCTKSTFPKTRIAFWAEKFSANVARDTRKARELADMDWLVMTIWECETKDIENTIGRVVTFLGPAKSPGGRVAR